MDTLSSKPMHIVVQDIKVCENVATPITSMCVLVDNEDQLI